MNRKTTSFIFSLLLMVTLLVTATVPALAQEATPTPLTIFTTYPSRIIGPGEPVTMPLKVRTSTAGTVSLEIQGLPEGWSASFRGGSQIVDAVYADGITDTSVDLRLEPAADAPAGTYPLTVAAVGAGEESAMPLSITIKEKLPPRLSLTVDGLPNKRGTPTSTFSYTATLKNEGGEDLLVALSTTQPENMSVKIQSSGQEVFELPLAANEAKNLTITAKPLIVLEAGEYPFTVQAAAGDIKTELKLIAEVVGEGSLSLSAPDGRLSAEAVAGEDNPLKIALVNTGTAPLLGIELSSSEPSGWSVTFDQSQIPEIPAGETVEVNAVVKPPENAIAGDYVVSINARPVDSSTETAQFRITVRTSTMWGVVGVALIAIAVGVVVLAVARFGRR